MLLYLRRRLELLVTGLAGVDLDARELLPMLLQMQRELALKNKLISALSTDQILLLLMQHDMGFKAGDARELLIANGAGEVRCSVCGPV